MRESAAHPAANGSSAESVSAICARRGNDPALLLEILHDIQEARGAAPDALAPEIAQALNLSRAEVHGVISFYHDFRRAPAGRIVVKLCRAEACQSMGALRLIQRICARHDVSLGETSAQGVTIEPVYCLGNCALAPAAMVNGKLHGRVDAERIQALIEEAGA